VQWIAMTKKVKIKQIVDHPFLNNNLDLTESYKFISQTLSGYEMPIIIRKRRIQHPIHFEKEFKMNPIVERILLVLIRQVLTEEMVKSALKQLVEGLAELSKRSDNEIDDAVVKIIADALGVDYSA